MLHANELRIGNAIKDGIVDGIYPHTQMSTVEVLTKEGVRKFIYLDLAEPIPLTPEIFEKCGWIWNKEANSFEKYPNGDARMHLQYREMNGSFTMFNYVLKAIIAERLYFLHQLQNLYFVLTGEELEWKANSQTTTDQQTVCS